LAAFLSQSTAQHGYFSTETIVGIRVEASFVENKTKISRHGHFCNDMLADDGQTWKLNVM